jgi:hypothetical protein
VSLVGPHDHSQITLICTGSLTTPPPIVAPVGPVPTNVIVLDPVECGLRVDILSIASATVLNSLDQAELKRNEAR